MILSYSDRIACDAACQRLNRDISNASKEIHDDFLAAGKKLDADIEAARQQIARSSWAILKVVVAK